MRAWSETISDNNDVLLDMTIITKSYHSHEFSMQWRAMNGDVSEHIPAPPQASASDLELSADRAAPYLIKARRDEHAPSAVLSSEALSAMETGLGGNYRKPFVALLILSACLPKRRKHRRACKFSVDASGEPEVRKCFWVISSSAGRKSISVVITIR